MKRTIGIIFIAISLVIIPFSIFEGNAYFKEKDNDKTINEIDKILNKVRETNDLSLLTSAKNILKKKKLITTSTKYEDITNLEFSIKRETIIKEYEDKINNLSANLNEEELNKLKEEINNIKYTDKKAELLEKLKVLEDEIAKRKKEEEKRKREEAARALEAKYKALDAEVVYSNNPGGPVLETIVGNISAYASGSYRASGKIHYIDPTYGKVYLVAADPSYPHGTIVRFKNLGYFGRDIYAMVKDRGGAIGKGKTYIPLDPTASAEIGDNLNPAEIELVSLKYVGDNPTQAKTDIMRIRIPEKDV